MQCDEANTTCIISLARRHCEEVLGWEAHCSSHYGDEYDTYSHEVIWKKVQRKWRRAFPPGVGYTKSILGHGMSRRKDVNGEFFPYVANPLIALAKGYAFRRSLCGGQRNLAMSLFVTYVLGRLPINTSKVGLCQGGALLIWMVLDTATIFYSPLRLVNTVYEGLMAMGLLAYLMSMTLSLQKRGRKCWLIKLSGIILWGMGWGMLSILLWLGMVDQVVIVVWFMTYAAFFPVSMAAFSPGATPPVIRSPWLASLAQRRSQRNV